jgi:hypothetical protein
MTMNQDTTVYFRMSDHFDQPELDTCQKYFRTVTRRTIIGPDQIVIPRYSMLPFGKELEDDIHVMGSQLINSFRQHSYVAELYNWYDDLRDLTPKTWFRLEDAHRESTGPFVLKGSTNSKKFSWRTHMYAKDRQAMGDVYFRLLEDGLVGTQSIVVREYVDLRSHGVMPCGIPISHEFRCFFFGEQLLTKAFYWSELDEVPEDNVPGDFLAEVARRVAPNINFWVADVAQTAKGDWIVVELNDGCMSGLSNNDPEVLYKSLAEAVSVCPILLG